MTEPEIFYRTAQGHLIAAEILSSFTSNSDGSPSVVFFAYYNNIGIAIELYLKAYLCIAGVSASKLSKFPFGHDIPYLYSVCADLFELDVVSSQMRKIIDLVGPTYYNHGYRYQKYNTIVGFIDRGTSTKNCFDALKQLDAFIRSVVQDSTNV